MIRRKCLIALVWRTNDVNLTPTGFHAHAMKLTIFSVLSLLDLVRLIQMTEMKEGKLLLIYYFGISCAVQAWIYIDISIKIILEYCIIRGKGSISIINSVDFILGTEIPTIAEACERSSLSIDCGEELINIKHAAYGVYSNENTCGLSHDGDCNSATSLKVLRRDWQ